jgi:hypothetical protein
MLSLRGNVNVPSNENRNVFPKMGKVSHNDRPSFPPRLNRTPLSASVGCRLPDILRLRHISCGYVVICRICRECTCKPVTKSERFLAPQNWCAHLVPLLLAGECSVGPPERISANFWADILACTFIAGHATRRKKAIGLLALSARRGVTRVCGARDRARLFNGRWPGEVETAANGVGTGAYKVIAQTAARKLGLDLSRVGDSRLPPGPLAGSPAPGWVGKLAGEGLWRKRHTYGEFVVRRI